MLRPFTAFVLPLLCAAAIGQTASTSVDLAKSAAWSKSVGSSSNGIEFEIEAVASFDRDAAAHGFYDRRSEIGAHASAVVHLFGSDIEAAYAGGELFAERDVSAYSCVSGVYSAGYATNGGGEASVRLGGRTLWSLDDWTSTAASRKTLAKVFGPYMVFPTEPSLTFWIGPVPITVSGNAGASATCSLDLWSNPAAPAVEIAGGVSGHVFGEARFSIGLACARASLVIELRFGEVEAGPVVRAAEGDVTGYFDCDLTAVAIEIRAEASWCVGSGSTTLWRYSSDTVSTRKSLS